MKIRLTKNNYSIDAVLISQNPFIFEIDGKKTTADIQKISKNLFSVILNNQSWFISFQDKYKDILISDSKNYSVFTIKNQLKIIMDDFGYENFETEKVGIIKAPIPGLITKLFVKKGDRIEAGSHVCVLEAMKMENEINSPINGLIKYINVKEGSSIEKGDIIMEID
ncbi:MAG: hypothetical protein CMF96_00550 [Candidatus Marinimicrobia bacterium]|nr:hypothetical protein [Candidatus Neomarinimicrobiota bacterium]|tara:strand:+ start:532 stop:1032 length:501 start_codon:yes stop_codon:yes gene_type:complete